jgi:hypothetical protein
VLQSKAQRVFPAKEKVKKSKILFPAEEAVDVYPDKGGGQTRS